MKVLVHIKRADDPKSDRNETKEFAEIPRIGDYVSFSSDDGGFLVYAVLHTPFVGDFEAEIFCVKGDLLVATKPPAPRSQRSSVASESAT